MPFWTFAIIEILDILILAFVGKKEGAENNIIEFKKTVIK